MAGKGYFSTHSGEILQYRSPGLEINCYLCRLVENITFHKLQKCLKLALLIYHSNSKTKNMATKKAKKAAKKPAAKKPAAKKAVKKAVKKAAPKKAVKKAAKKKPARKPNAAFMKPLTPSNDLAAVIGSKALPRTEAVKKIWVYIKANKLQDAKNRRMINADAKLKSVFGGKSQVSMFDMAKHMSKHLK